MKKDKNKISFFISINNYSNRVCSYFNILYNQSFRISLWMEKCLGISDINDKVFRSLHDLRVKLIDHR